VQQRSPEWHEIRRLGGSQIGAACGLSKYQSPQELVKTFFEPFAGERKFVDHGTAMEPTTDLAFRRWLKGNEVRNSFDTADTVTMTGMSRGVVYGSGTALKGGAKGGAKNPSPETIEAWKRQLESEEPGYLTLDPSVDHPLFDSKRDAAWFGASLDYEGSEIDAEYKNPFTYFSFFRNYMETIDCAYFAQIQWIMAMRQRKAMFFVATSIDASIPASSTSSTSAPVVASTFASTFASTSASGGGGGGGGGSGSGSGGEKKNAPVILGMVIWYVRFSKRFFREVIYPGAVACGRAIYDKEGIADVAQIPWLNKTGKYHTAPVYRTLLARYASRVYLYKNGAEIRKRISARKE